MAMYEILSTETSVSQTNNYSQVTSFIPCCSDTQKRAMFFKETNCLNAFDEFKSTDKHLYYLSRGGGGGGGSRVVRWCWLNFQCHIVLLITIIIGQGPTALAVGAWGCCWFGHFLSSIISLFLPLSGRRPNID